LLHIRRNKHRRRRHDYTAIGIAAHDKAEEAVSAPTRKKPADLTGGLDLGRGGASDSEIPVHPR
jgi:hypothetical protein